MPSAIQPFRIAAERRRPRRPAPPSARDALARAARRVDDWSQGIPLAYVQDVCALLGRRSTTGARARRGSTASRSSAPSIDGLGIHFLHVRSPHADALPLVITHGWPGSIVEFQKVIGPLTDPTAHGGDAADAFHVVCPSLPGYGFSDKPTQHGLEASSAIAERVGAADGAARLRRATSRRAATGARCVTTRIGMQDAAHCAGIHLNMPIALARPGDAGRPDRAASRARSPACSTTSEWDSGYSKQQCTRPQTLGLRAGRLARGPGRVDPREVLGLDRLRRPPRERRSRATSCSTT